MALTASTFAPPASMRDRDLDVTLACVREDHALRNYLAKPQWTTRFEAKATVQLHQPEPGWLNEGGLFRRFTVVRMDDSLFVLSDPPVGPTKLGRTVAFGPTDGWDSFGTEGFIIGTNRFQRNVEETATSVKWHKIFYQNLGPDVDDEVNL